MPRLVTRPELEVEPGTDVTPQMLRDAVSDSIAQYKDRNARLIEPPKLNAAGSWQWAVELDADKGETMSDIWLKGNPDGTPLMASLAEIAQWADYEAEVVDAAADEPDVPDDVASAAADQADAMHAAADALSEASDQAAVTAAAAFVDTGIPSDENPEHVVQGNPQPVPPNPAPSPVTHGNPTLAVSEGIDGERVTVGSSTAEAVEEASRLASETGQTYAVWRDGGIYVMVSPPADALTLGNPSAPYLSVAPSRAQPMLPPSPAPMPDPGTQLAAPDIAPVPDHWYNKPLFKVRS